MKDCALVRDLLPLYLDGEVSEESREAIRAHLETCPDCRGALARLNAASENRKAAENWRPWGTPEEPPSGGAALVIRRLRRRLLVLVALVAVVTLIVGFSVRRYEDWSNRRAVQREQQEMRIQQNGAIASLDQVSPPPKVMYERLGLGFTVQAKRIGEGALRVDYHWGRPGESVDRPPASNPDTRLYAFEVWGRNLRLALVDPATGDEVPFSGGQGSAGWGHGGGDGYQEFIGAPATGNLRVKAEIPPVLIYETPSSPLRLDLQPAGVEGETTIDRKFTSNGVDFLISRLSIQGCKATVEYQQLTPVAEAGVHFLSFLLYPSSAMDPSKYPHEEVPLQPMPDPKKPQQVFDLSYLGSTGSAAPATGTHLTLELEHVVTAVPGTTILSVRIEAGK